MGTVDPKAVMEVAIIVVSAIVGGAAYWIGWWNGWTSGRREERARWTELFAAPLEKAGDVRTAQEVLMEADRVKGR